MNLNLHPRLQREKGRFFRSVGGKKKKEKERERKGGEKGEFGRISDFSLHFPQDPSLDLRRTVEGFYCSLMLPISKCKRHFFKDIFFNKIK